MHTHIELSGPEFLDTVADAEDGNGNYINASEYRRRAHQWKCDQDALRKAQAHSQALEDRLADIRRQAHIT